MSAQHGQMNVASDDVIAAVADLLNEVSQRKDDGYLEGGFEHEAHALAAAGLLATRSEAHRALADRDAEIERLRAVLTNARAVSGDLIADRDKMLRDVMGERDEALHALADAEARLAAVRSEAEVKAEALREFADELAAIACEGNDDWWHGYEQAQLEAEEAAVRRANSLAPARSDASEAEASEIARDLARQSAFYRDNPREDARPEEDEGDQ